MLKTLPKDLTSYDFLKIIAVTLMIADHLGYYFYPDDMWFRTFGRLCVPIWFFLIGYANTREIPKSLWIGAGLLVVTSMISGAHFFPLTILFGLMATRHMIDRIMAHALRSYETLAGMFFLLFLATYPTSIFVEYGTMGGLFAMFGFMVRHKEVLELKKKPYVIFIAASLFVYIISQSLLMPSLSGAQFAVLSLGSIFVCMLLGVFQPLTFPRLSQALTPPITGLLKLLGRRTLEIYVLHLLLLRAIAMVINPDDYGFYQWSLFPPGGSEYFMRLLF